MIKPETSHNNNLQNVAIHKASKSDAGAIAALAIELAAYEQVETLCNEQAIASLFDTNRTPRCEMIVARDGDAVIGFAIFYAGYDLASHSYGYHLADICVAQTHRRRGVGHAMLAHIAQTALSDGREWLSLTALDDNLPAQDFYAGLGFTKVEVGFWAAGRGVLKQILDATPD